MFHVIYRKTKEQVVKVWEKEDTYMNFVLGLELNHQLGWLEIGFVYNPLKYK